jgi:hypothetical protein
LIDRSLAAAVNRSLCCRSISLLSIDLSAADVIELLLLLLLLLLL